MARFYNTSQTEFVDYQTQGQSPAGANSGADLFADINALPQDRPRLQEIISGYESEIGNIVSQLQANPRSMRSLQPQIANIRQRLAMDRTAGELKAIQDRYSQYGEVRKGYQEALKDDPFQATMASSLLDEQIEPIQYDPITGSFNEIKPEAYVAPFTDAEKNKWFSTYVPKIQSTVLDQVREQEGLDRFTTLLERGELKGVVKDRALRILAQQITPQMIAAENQRRRLAGDQQIDENTFFDFATGRPNLNTYLGRMVEAAAESAANVQRDTQFIQNQDEAALERMKGNEDLRVARGRARIEDRDANWWADRLGALYRGEGYDTSHQTVDGVRKRSSFLRGQQTHDGFIVDSVQYLPRPGRPAEAVVILQKPAVKNSQGVELSPAEKRTAPMNIDFFTSLEGFPSSYIPKIANVLETDELYSPTQERLERTEDRPTRRQPQQRQQNTPSSRRRVPGINY